MSRGIPIKAINGMNVLSKMKGQDKPENFVIRNPHVTKLIEDLSMKSTHIPPSLI